MNDIYIMLVPVISALITVGIPAFVSIIPKQEDKVSYWSNLAESFKQDRDDCQERLDIVEKKLKEHDNELLNLKSSLKVYKFKLRVAVNYIKDLLKYLKNHGLKDEPFIPSEIEDEFKEKEEINNE